MKEVSSIPLDYFLLDLRRSTILSPFFIQMYSYHLEAKLVTSKT